MKITKSNPSTIRIERNWIKRFDLLGYKRLKHCAQLCNTVHNAYFRISILLQNRKEGDFESSQIDIQMYIMLYN